MKNKLLSLLVVPLYCTLFTSGCVKLPAPAAALSYPETSQVQVTFQRDAVPADCMVFSHRLTFTPAGITGKQVQDSLIANAKANGADMILIGLVREQPEADLEEYQYHTYGPSSPYLFQSRWNGWKFGFKDWRKQGAVIDFGINALQDNKTDYRQGIILQNIYLTCPSPQQASKK